MRPVLGPTRGSPRRVAVALALLTGLAASLPGCAATSAASAPAAVSIASNPEPLTQPRGVHRELRMLDVTLGNGGRVRLEAALTRPEGQGPFPLILFSHGSPRGSDDEARAMAPTRHTAQAVAFARAGYAVVDVMRRGYGRSEGTRFHAGPCDARDYLRAGRADADDLLGTLRALGSEPSIDGARVVLAGVSAGGFASISAAAALGSGAGMIRGVLSFAGGRGSNAPDSVCQPDRLVAAFGSYGATLRVPSLWMYAPNDHYFGPALSRAFADAYRAGGAPLELVTVPPFGEDGHLFFSDGPLDVWWPEVAAFLERVGLPGGPLPASSDHPPLPPPAALRPKGLIGFETYRASDGYEKAFAVGQRGAWGSAVGKRSRAEAVAAAVDNCRKHGDGCVAYAVGDTVVGPG
jgi:dienelactone hydrolase